MQGGSMKLKVFQKGFNYSQDGRGNRLVWHLQGCNMKCPWCANPEGMAPEGVLMTDPEWLNESCCPMGAVIKENPGEGKSPDQAGKWILDRSRCRDCRERPCIESMRQKGIRLSCAEMETSDMLAESMRCMPMFFDGGGVTLTGGEMSLRFEAVRELLEGLGKAGIHRCVETNGSHPRSRELFPLVDEWIMDLKHIDSAKHEAWLGIGNERIIDTLRAVTQEHPDVLIRIPLMPGFNDSEEDAKAMAALLAPLAGGERRANVRVEVLTYHEFGKGKWAQCGMDYQMKGGRIEPEQRAFLEEQLKNAGIQVVRT